MTMGWNLQTCETKETFPSYKLINLGIFVTAIESCDKAINTMALILASVFLLIDVLLAECCKKSYSGVRSEAHELPLR
jgi:hypothetical protein